MDCVGRTMEVNRIKGNLKDSGWMRSSSGLKRIPYEDVTHTHTKFLFNWPIFPELFQVRLLQVRPVLKSKLLGIVVAELLQAGCPSCHPTNSNKALGDDSAPD